MGVLSWAGQAGALLLTVVFVLCAISIGVAAQGQDSELQFGRWNVSVFVDYGKSGKPRDANIKWFNRGKTEHNSCLMTFSGAEWKFISHATNDHWKEDWIKAEMWRGHLLFLSNWFQPWEGSKALIVRRIIPQGFTLAALSPISGKITSINEEKRGWDDMLRWGISSICQDEAQFDLHLSWSEGQRASYLYGGKFHPRSLGGPEGLVSLFESHPLEHAYCEQKAGKFSYWIKPVKANHWPFVDKFSIFILLVVVCAFAISSTKGMFAAILILFGWLWFTAKPSNGLPYNNNRGDHLYNNWSISRNECLLNGESFFEKESVKCGASIIDFIDQTGKRNV